MNSYNADPSYNLDAYTDTLYSVRRWLNELYPELKILLERDTNDFQRPSFKLYFGPQSKVVNMTGFFWRSERKIYIRYHGTSQVDNHRVLSRIEHKIQNIRWLIPHFIRDLVYCQPSLREVSDDGALDAGTYKIRVEARTLLGDWTLASEPVEIDVSQDSSIKVLIPNISQVRYFDKFRIFVEVTEIPEDEEEEPVVVYRLLAEVNANANALLTTYTITTLDDVTETALQTTSEVYYKFLRVSDVETMIIEDPFVKNTHDVIYGFTASFMNIRSLIQNATIGSVVANITTTIEVE